MYIPRLYYVTYLVDGDSTLTDNDDLPGAVPNVATVSDLKSTLSLDTVFELLSNQRRRFTLYTLSEATDGVTQLTALLHEMATLESALTNKALTHEQYADIATDLYHWHLPVLADVEIIDYDVRHKTIMYRPHPQLEMWLDRARNDELGWGSDSI